MKQGEWVGTSEPTHLRRRKLRPKQILRRVQAEIGKLVQALKDGVPAGIVKDPPIGWEPQQTELRARLDRAAQPPPLLHPNMADLYREKVTQLARGLEHEVSRTGAAEALRGLMDAIILTL